MRRYDIINYIIKSRKYSRYLEIGVRRGSCFKKIKCANKEGVDPRSRRNKYIKYTMKSDDFFKMIPVSQKYDIIFIDALHEEKQVLRDVNNSLNHLICGGTIVLHDCNIPEENHPCGTVWKAIVSLRMNRNDLKICVVDADFGCGIISLGSQKILDIPKGTNLTYEFLDSSRKKLLNLISEEEFKKRFLCTNN